MYRDILPTLGGRPGRRGVGSNGVEARELTGVSLGRDSGSASLSLEDSSLSLLLLEPDWLASSACELCSVSVSAGAEGST